MAMTLCVANHSVVASGQCYVEAKGDKCEQTVAVSMHGPGDVIGAPKASSKCSHYIGKREAFNQEAAAQAAAVQKV